MKIAALYNFWDGEELLRYSVDNILPVVDKVIIVYSSYSNWGQHKIHNNFITHPKVSYLKWEPELTQPAHTNEREKRNIGLSNARDLGFTHFIMLDCDEFYDTKEFVYEKDNIERNDIAGTVCGLQTYFKQPTLTIGQDWTLVPFIHKITPTLKFDRNHNYPYAYQSGSARIDPTRRLNINSGVEFSSITMHHYSWVRKDIEEKINNSSARNNLLKSTALEDWNNARPGYFCKMYQKNLIECDNKFGIQI